MTDKAVPQQQLVKVPRKVVRELPVKLTEHEMASVAKEIGRLNRERSAMEAQAKVSASQWKDRIGGLDAQIGDLATKADVGVENRPVDCEEVHDYRMGEVRVHRLDDGQQLEVRPMTADERQPSLPAPGMDKPAKPKKGDKDPPKDTPADAAVAANDAAGPPVDADGPPGAEVTAPQAVLDAESTALADKRAAKAARDKDTV